MLSCCSDFADDHHILFNQAKSHCIQFSLTKLDVSQYNVLLPALPLTWTSQITHLGHVLQTNNKDSADIAAQLNNFISQSNYFLARFGHLSVVIKSKLFANFCQAFYACEL